MAIHILSTGGTIDKIHDPITEKLIFGDRSHVSDMVSNSNVPNLQFSSVMLKDSLDINNDDRQIMADFVAACDEERIIITHGTSTMVETAQFIAQHSSDKIIVLTGAMRPYSLFQGDSEFNLGCAIGAVQTLDSGVYIAMNGQIFNHDNVVKNTELGIFQKVK